MLYYLHGYLSGPNSTKGKLMRERFNALPIDYQQNQSEILDVDKSLREIMETIADDTDPILIGSSFGGFLAAETALSSAAVKTIILLNPAIIPPRADTHLLIGIPEHIIEKMRDNRLFETKLQARVFILLGIRDEVVPADWSISFAKAQKATVTFLDDDHAFTGNPFRLLNIVEEILSKC
jgi:predicted esterase YcpF (UPF0227 family)